MAVTPNTQYRARLFREVSQDLNRVPRHTARPVNPAGNSLEDSTASCFDPQNEAIASTQQMEESHYTLPALQNSTAEPDFVIDYDALAKVFPDFSSASEMSDNSSVSIEVGRGKKKENGPVPTRFRQSEASSKAPHKLGGDHRRPANATAGKMDMSTTPLSLPRLVGPKSGEKKTGKTKEQLPNDLFAIENKENRRPLSKGAGVGSRQGVYDSGSRRRTLGTMHARVTEENDDSLTGQERPPTIDLTSRSTRFGRANNRAGGAGPNATKAGSGDIIALGREQLKKAISEAVTSNSFNANATQQSYMLPDLPNLSELVSGVYPNGTPVFPRAGSHASRFSVNRPNNHQVDEVDHAAVESIPMPSEEKAILVSLRILQDKIVELEGERADTEKTMQELQNEIAALKAERQEMQQQRRSDSALGMGDSGSDGAEYMGKGRSKFAVEKIKLEKIIKSLEDRLDVATRKLSVSDIAMRNLTRERDSADARLGLAYCSAEELKVENQDLATENDALKQQLARFIEEREAERQQWAKREVSLMKKIERRDEAVTEVREMTRDLWDLRKPHESVSALRPQDERRTHIEASSTKQNVVNNTGKNQLSHSAFHGKVGNAGQRSNAAQQDLPKKKRTRKVVIEETINSDISELDYVNLDGRGNTRNLIDDADADESVASDSTGASQLTTLSFVAGDEIAKLRKTLEEERAKQRGPRTQASLGEPDDHIAPRSTEPIVLNVREQAPLVRKSSLKAATKISSADPVETENEEHTGKYSVKAGENTEDLSEEHIPMDEAHGATQNSGHARRRAGTSRTGKDFRRRLAKDNMTSAFIVPDITIRGSSAPGQAGLSVDAQCVWDGLAEHDGRSCTVCRRITSYNKNVLRSSDLNATGTKGVINIPIPVPVSERMPKSVPYEDEPTMRPSQPPAVALAVVMKALEDELAHLKLELAPYQAAYNKHDASLGKQKRKLLAKKIATLLKAIDTKADQIYGLYDVLEGQKADGHVISEEAVEVTLNSLGLDLAELGASIGKKREMKNRGAQIGRSHDDTFDGSSDGEDLPWEGIEETVRTSKSRRSSGSRRSTLGA